LYGILFRRKIFFSENFTVSTQIRSIFEDAFLFVIRSDLINIGNAYYPQWVLMR